MKILFVISSSQRKLSTSSKEPIKAENYFIGTQFKLFKSYVEKTSEKWIIFSPILGFIEPDYLISASTSSIFSEKSEIPNVEIVEQLKKYSEYDKIVVLGGTKLLNMIKSAFKQYPVEIVSPTQGLSLGQSMHRIVTEQTKITNLELINYRNFKGTKIYNFDLKNDTDINFIIGPNESGKTNIIRAIAWCLTGHEKIEYSEINNTLDEKRIANIDRLNKIKNNENMSVSVTLTITDHFKKYSIKRGFTISKKLNKFILDKYFNVYEIVNKVFIEIYDTDKIINYLFPKYLLSASIMSDSVNYQLFSEAEKLYEIIHNIRLSNVINDYDALFNGFINNIYYVTNNNFPIKKDQLNKIFYSKLNFVNIIKNINEKNRFLILCAFLVSYYKNSNKYIPIFMDNAMNILDNETKIRLLELFTSILKITQINIFANDLQFELFNSNLSKNFNILSLKERELINIKVNQQDAEKILSLANGIKNITIKDTATITNIINNIRKNYPDYFESYSFLCPFCKGKHRETIIRYSKRKDYYSIQCSNCNKIMDKVNIQIPIIVNIISIVLDTSAIIEGTLSKLVNQNYFVDKIAVIIPTVVGQEINMMEKPPNNYTKEMKNEQKRKVRRALEEYAKLNQLDVDGKIHIKSNFGEKLSENDIRLKLEGVDKNIADEKILEICRLSGSLLLTKDEWLSKRANSQKINSLFIKKIRNR